MASLEIKVSAACYNELAETLNKLGKKIAPGATITIDKDEKIIDPTDWRFLKVRENAVMFAAQAYFAYDKANEARSSKGFTEFANEIYRFILIGKMPTAPLAIDETSASKEGWQ